MARVTIAQMQAEVEQVNRELLSLQAANQQLLEQRREARKYLDTLKQENRDLEVTIQNLAHVLRHGVAK